MITTFYNINNNHIIKLEKSLVTKYRNLNPTYIIILTRPSPRVKVEREVVG